jgi:hypothetical protein
MICLIWEPPDAETALYFYCENKIFRSEVRWGSEFEYNDNHGGWFPSVTDGYYRGMYV